MPPITSPRRPAFHPAPTALSRPVPITGGGGASHNQIPASAAAAAHSFGTASASFGSTPPSLISGSGSAGTSPCARSPPYMVALAGWPEPMFVAEARDTWERKRSRPTTPTGTSRPLPPLSGSEVRDGVSFPPAISESRDDDRSPFAAVRGISMARTASGSVPIDPALRSRPGSPVGNGHASPSFPTSSARDTAHDGSPSPGSGTHSAHSTGSSSARTMRRGHPERHSTFADPRYGVNAAVLGHRITRALRVAPSWASSSSTPSQHHNHHHHSHTYTHPSTPYAGPGTHAAMSATRGRVALPGSTVGAAGGPSGHNKTTSSSSSANGDAVARPESSSSASIDRGAPWPRHPSDLRTGAMFIPHRATPEVWPPPKHHLPMAGGVVAGNSGLATQVYPRDPDSPWVWKQGSPDIGAGASHASSPAAGSVRDEKMDVDQ